MMLRRKSAVRPLASVSRPASKICRQRSKTLRCDFSISSSKQDDERPFAHHGGEQAGGAALADQAFKGLVSGVFAHVEADQPGRVAEQQFRQGAGQFGLADAGGADEQLHAERLVGVVQPGLDESHQIDNGVDGLGLAHDAGLEEGADGGAVERHGVVEEVGRDAGGGREGFDDFAVAERPLAVGGAEDAAEQADGAARLDGAAGVEVGQFHKAVEHGVGGVGAGLGGDGLEDDPRLLGSGLRQSGPCGTGGAASARRPAPCETLRRCSRRGRECRRVRCAAPGRRRRSCRSCW